jgi:Flp pilus assembly pilin Flp
MKTSQAVRQLGQGMTEYIIIVALIAIAAIGVFTFFGGTIRGQVGAMSQELAGQESSSSKAAATASAGQAAAQGAANKDLSNFNEGNK